MKKAFALKKPCANCPFRNDENAIELREGRREGIIEDLLTGRAETFPCHKTVYNPNSNNFDDDGNYMPQDVSLCPGAAAVARKYGRDTVMVQVATRLGLIESDFLDEAMKLVLEPGDLLVDRKKCHL